MGDVRSPSGESDSPGAAGQIVLEGSEQGFATTKLNDLLGWARKWSLFKYPFVTACCGMEFMADFALPSA